MSQQKHTPGRTATAKTMRADQAARAERSRRASWGVQRVTVRGSACPQVETYFEVGGE